MTVPVRMDILSASHPIGNSIVSDTLPAELSTADLAFRVFAAFRAHPHICNVLTHISRSSWTHVESALNAILDPATASDGLSPLAHNLLDLMCAERGITGKILKPYFHAVLHRQLGPIAAEGLIRHIEALFTDLERKAEQPAPAHAPPQVSSTGDSS